MNEDFSELEVQVYLLLDASGSMSGKELKTGQQKSKRVGWMVQELLSGMDDPQYEFACVTVACFAAGNDGAKVLCLLDAHNPFYLKTYTQSPNPEFWDPLSPAHRLQGMGPYTPIGTALAWARSKAEQWVNEADGQVKRRGVIYLLSDGESNYGPDGREEKKAIEAFNASCEKGRIRLATIGYFQSEPGKNKDEDEGRKLLNELATRGEYFESDDVEKIVRYVLSTVTQERDQDITAEVMEMVEN
jgi:uncharacterized protein YegL